MPVNNDSDVKIFKTSKKQESDTDILKTVEVLDINRKNGNLRKAKELGIIIADSEWVIINDLFGKEKETVVKQQIGVLLMFSTEAALNYFLPSTQIAAIAIGSFHDRISEYDPSLYETVMESPGFSFYYLNIRKCQEDVPKAIGKAFAMLGQHDGDEAYIEKGKEVYTLALKNVEKKISEIDFN